MRRAALLAALLLAPLAPARAAERHYTVTGFEGVSVEGPWAVVLTTGGPPSVRASGDQHAIDAIRVEVQGRTLHLKREGGTLGQDDNLGPVAITITTHELVNAGLVGTGSLSIDAMKGGRVNLAVVGSGKASVGAITADRANVAVVGAGTLTASGEVLALKIAVQGAGTIAAPGLVAKDAEIALNGSGDLTLAASHSAKVASSGTGNVTVTGDVACTVTAQGSGLVRCGRKGR